MKCLSYDKLYYTIIKNKIKRYLSVDIKKENLETDSYVNRPKPRVRKHKGKTVNKKKKQGL